MTVFIKKGDKPLSIRQATTRGTQIVSRELGAAGARAGDETIFAASSHEDLPQRLVEVLALLPGAPSTYSEYAAQWEISNQTNSANNLFNHQLVAYRNYTARLSQYRLADGREEITEQRETGGVDADGLPVFETAIVSEKIEPLPSQVEEPVFNENSGEQEGVNLIPNPLLVKDETERQTAQMILDSLPESVGLFSNDK